MGGRREQVQSVRVYVPDNDFEKQARIVSGGDPNLIMSRMQKHRRVVKPSSKLTPEQQGAFMQFSRDREKFLQQGADLTSEEWDELRQEASDSVLRLPADDLHAKKIKKTRGEWE